MPFDPAQPSFHAPNSSELLRDQFNALNDKIDAVPAGPPGADGADGAPGEVTNAQLASEIVGTARNPSGVFTLGLSVSDPPTQTEMQALASRLDELITALRREP